MKESIQKTKQLARIIQESGRNQKVGFVDNRQSGTTLSLLSSLSRFQYVAQMKNIIKEEPQSFDRRGRHVSKGQTDPYNLVRTLNGSKYSNLIEDRSGTRFQNAHMMAATFGGSNAIDNIVAWSSVMENNWSDAENEIRGVNTRILSKPRKEENGIVKTNIFIDENDSYSRVIDQLMGISYPFLINPSNWDKVAPDSVPLTEGTLRGAYNDGYMLERLKTQMEVDVKKAFDRMPNKAIISYQSEKPDNKRQYKWRFNTNIVDPIVSARATPQVIVPLMKPLKIDGWEIK